jgi:hypothetical protein
MLALQLEQRPSLVRAVLPQLQQTTGALHFGQSFKLGTVKCPQFQQEGNSSLFGSYRFKPFSVQPRQIL